MNEYLLFVDTETSGLPKDWRKPYAAENNWPHIVQLAWVVYTREGQEVKSENHYIKASDFKISNASRKIHGITDKFLEQNGKDRASVMKLLHQDLLTYKPLVVAHFMLLDYHMLGLGFYRTNLDNPLKTLQTFCTMEVTAQLPHLSEKNYLRLEELYTRLFEEKLELQHDALVDAYAAARCFFELWGRGDINEQVIAQQEVLLGLSEPDQPLVHWNGAVFFLGFMVILILLYFFIS